MFLKKYWVFLVLLLIFAVSLFLRLYHLGSTPSGFHQDEVVNTYIGRFIFENGKDIYGNSWPLSYFDKRGDYPPVIPMYFSALGTYLFGITTFASRFPIALLSSLAVFPMYLLGLWTFRNKKTALLGAFLIAIIPWHVSFSRIGAEGMVALTVYMFGIALLVRSIQKDRVTQLIGGVLLLLFTYFMYPSFRISVPLTFLIAGIFFIDFKRRIFINSKTRYVLIAAFILSMVLTVAIGSTQWGKGRYDQTSILSAYANGQNPMSPYIFNENNVWMARIFDNKAVYVAREFLHQYALYLSPQYLFVEGGSPDWFDVPLTGLFYYSFLLLLLPLVIPYLQRKIPDENRNMFYFFIAMFFIAPIPSALTTEFTPNTHRSILMILPSIILLLYGFEQLRFSQTGRKIIAVFAIVLLGEFILFSHNYFQHVNMHTSVLREDGNLQAAKYIKENRMKFDKVYAMVTGWFPVYYLFETKNFSSSLIGSFRLGLRTERVDNVEFVETDCPDIDFFRKNTGHKGIAENEHMMIVISSTCKFPWKTFKQIGSISGANRVPVYNIFEWDPKRVAIDL